MSKILTIGDTYSYDTVCPIPGHTGGSDPLSDAGQDFVFIDNKLVVLQGTTHTSSCPLGCTMTITGTPQTHVYINDTLIACNGGQGDMGGCHPSVTVVSNCQNDWVDIS